MIEAVELGNFKGLQQNATLPLGQLTLIVGCEGSGKSTALQGLAAHFLPRDRWTYDSVKRHGLQPERAVISYALWKEPGNELYGRLCWSKSSPTGGLRGGGYFYRVSGSGRLDRFMTASRGAFFMDPTAMAEVAWLKNCCPDLDSDGRNLARMLKLLQQHQPNQFRKLNREFIQWLPQFAEIVLQQPRRGYRLVAFRNRQGACIPAADLSPNVLLILGLLSLSYLAEVSILGLDEPDYGLNPSQLLMLRERLLRLAFPKLSRKKGAPAQVIVTTRDPAFVQLFEGQTITVVLTRKTEQGISFVLLDQIADLRQHMPSRVANSE